MNIISPLHTKLIIAVPPVVEIMPITSNKRKPETRRLFGVADWECDERMIFLFLERQRFEKLKELYKGSKLRMSGIRKKENDDAISLKLPPRYQCLDFSAESFFSEMQKQHHPLPIPFQHDDQWKSGVD